MSNRVKSVVAIVLMLVMVLLTACGKEKYSVIVTGGSANSPEFSPGEVVRLAAVIPDDKEFVKWNVNDDSVILSDENSETATFVMPKANVQITATFQEHEQHMPGIDTMLFTSDDGEIGRRIFYTNSDGSFSHSILLTSATLGYDDDQALNLFDLNQETKWRLPFYNSAFVEWEYDAPVKAKTLFITGGNNRDEDPSWVHVYAKNSSNEEWIWLVSHNLAFPFDYLERDFDLSISPAYAEYKYYRLEFTDSDDGDTLQNLQLTGIRMEFAPAE